MNECVLLLTDVFELFDLDVLALLSYGGQFLNQLHWERETKKKAICLVIFFLKLKSNHLCLFCFCLNESLTLELCSPCWCIWAEVIYFSTPHKRTCAQAAQSRLQFINLHYVINLRWPAMTSGHHLLTKSTSQAAIFLILPLQYRFLLLL